MTNEIWDKRRRQLEDAVVLAALNLTEHMGCGGFCTPVPGTKPAIFVACGTAEALASLPPTNIKE